MQFYIREFLDHRIFNLFLKEKKKRIFFWIFLLFFLGNKLCRAADDKNDRRVY